MGMISLLTSFWHACIGMPHCLLCHDYAHVSGLCRACWHDMAALQRTDTDICLRCRGGRLLAGLCEQCQQQWPFTTLYASYRYAAPLQQMLSAFKHQRQLALLDTLAALMLAQPPQWLAQVKIDAVLAMPLSRKRLFERGFNQSQLLAAIIARHYALPVLRSDCVQRCYRPPQSTLKKSARQRNVRGVFRLNHAVKKRNLLLIDDVVTTGATITELAQTLRKSGASRIYVWTLAHPE
ncbi:ComF family protein [Snodgrassella alvi]|nr:ComF family protein [Snodgrassella alvi]